MTMHPALKKPSRIKHIPSSTVEYEKEIHPPLTDDVTELKELITQTLIGKRILKRFEKRIYFGTITSAWIDDDHHQYWRIRYDDEDGKDSNLKEIREALTLYKLYPNEYRFSDHATSTTLRISNERGADILNEKGTDVSNKRGANISNEKEDDISNKRGDDISNERGADILNEKKDDISNERGADITPPRRSSRLKRNRETYRKMLKNYSKTWSYIFHVICHCSTKYDFDTASNITV
jgi:hypothetical protein